MDGMGYQTHASNQLHDYQTTTETTSTFNKKKAIDKPWPKVAGMSDSGTAVFSVWCFVGGILTPRKFNIAPKNRQSQKETHLPTIIFQGLC